MLVVSDEILLLDRQRPLAVDSLIGVGNDGYVLSDGERHLILQWDVDLGTLKSVSFKYDLPGSGAG